MNIEEEKILNQYNVKENYFDFYRPSKDYSEICFKFGSEYHIAAINGASLPVDANEIYEENEKSYIKILGKILTVFESEVAKGKIDSKGFPIKDWKHFTNRDETRFIMNDFYKIYAMTAESIIKSKADYLVYPLINLTPEEHSKVLGNLSNTQTFIRFIKSIESISPHVLKDESFNPLESIINEGNPEFLKLALEDSRIQDMVKEGVIKPIEKIEIDGDLIRRLASDFDNKKKTNIVNCIKILSEYGLLEKQLKGIDSKNKNNYMLLNQIQPSDKLSYIDVYLYSINNVPLFSNNNAKIVSNFKLQEEKRGYEPSKSRMKP